MGPAERPAGLTEPPAARWAFRAAVALGGLAPAACGLWRPETWPWLGAGALGWLVAVIAVKAPLAAALGPVAARLGPGAAGALLGLLSGATELAAVPAILHGLGRPPSIAALLAIGLGAAAIEAVLVGGEAGLAGLDPEAPKPAAPGRTAWWVPFAFPIERWLVAAPGHVGARGLVAASWLGAGWGPAIVAVVAFALVDGVPTAAERRGVRWDDPGVLGRYYAFAGGLGWLELGLAVYALGGL